MEMGEKVKEKSSGKDFPRISIPKALLSQLENPIFWVLGQVFSNIQHFSATWDPQSHLEFCAGIH